MSLSWLDRLTLFIHPQRVVLERQPWRGAPSSQAAEVASPAPGEADWQPVLAAADALLKTAGKGAALRIVVADHLVRYALLPWSDMLTGKAARLGLARALFRNALGERAAALDIALDRPAFGKNGIAAGIDRQLLAGLRAAAKARRLRLNSVQPRLIAELAAQQTQLNDGWLACLDLGWLTLAGVRDGEIASLRNHRASTAEPALLAGELAGLLAAESATVNGKKVLISTSAVAAPKLAGGWETTLVTPVAGGVHA
ncbi:hypothetical protein [Ferribacterium limneticum]|uniref:hypothetical protein n=1 Tax=Ferribacterium limneticum TaxID=76259 RepID=UPI001CF85FC8|nr:hypothetical protein [Ferribacterium limneticum]UCV21342.1 hypothetical protein KI613_12365 [Ferribacterium limneticum]